MNTLDFGSMLTLLLLIPYFWWGLYTLRQRFHYHRELNSGVEVASLAALAFFFLVEVALLKNWFRNAPGLFVFYILGLVVSSAALYGPIFASVTSRFLVDLVMPSGHVDVLEPRLGPAEALERTGDYDGALQEYLVIARIFREDPTVALRVADNLMKLERSREAAIWFERALERIHAPGPALAISNRLCEIYQRDFQLPDEAARVLEHYLIRFPGVEHSHSIHERLAQLRGPASAAAPAPVPPGDLSG